ncbi:unnamed protein product, partial [Polarella glacialis]
MGMLCCCRGSSRTDEEDEWTQIDFSEELARDHTGSRFTLHESNRFRHGWAILNGVLLLYISSIFVFRIVFVDLRVGSDVNLPSYWKDGWDNWDFFVDLVFWMDLFLRFTFTYEDDSGREVDSLSLIARKYVCSGDLFMNIVACLPRQTFTIFYDEGETPFSSQTVRVLRLQKFARLTRLLLTTRVARRVNVGLPCSKLMQGGNILFAFGLVVHFLACGWYLTAALNDYPEETWVARRKLIRGGPQPPPGGCPEGDTVEMFDLRPEEQWIHAMYFILTVFSTVGFGDITPMTTVEMVYVCFTLMVGTMFHSYII